MKNATSSALLTNLPSIHINSVAVGHVIAGIGIYLLGAWGVRLLISSNSSPKDRFFTGIGFVLLYAGFVITGALP